MKLVNDAILSFLTSKLVSGAAWAAQFLLATPTSFFGSSGFRQLYAQMAVLADMTLLPITAAWGLAIMFGYRGRVTGAFKRLLIAAVAVNAVPWAVELLVDLANAMSRYVLTTTSLTMPKEFPNLPGAELAILIFIAAYVWFLVQVVLQTAYRYYALLAWTVFAPVIFTLSALPGQEERSWKWAREVGSLLAEQIAMAVQFSLLVALTIGPAAVAKVGIESLLIQLGGLIAMSRTPAVIREWVHSENIGSLKTVIGMLTFAKLGGFTPKALLGAGITKGLVAKGAKK